MSPLSPSASSGVIGRRWTVPPSAATTSASQCAGGGVSRSGAGWSSITGVVRVEAEVGEAGPPSPQDGPVDAGVAEAVPAAEAGVAALGHVSGRADAQPAALDVVPPCLRDLGLRVDAVPARLGQEVRPGPGHAAHEAVAPSAQHQPPPVTQ